jgi:hypothetical protein
MVESQSVHRAWRIAHSLALLFAVGATAVLFLFASRVVQVIGPWFLTMTAAHPGAVIGMLNAIGGSSLLAMSWSEWRKRQQRV